MSEVERPSRTVLLVDDNEADAELMSEYLALHEGVQYVLHRASQFEDAMAVLRSTKIDVVLLDLFLPDVVATTGVAEMCVLAGDVPIMMLTGRGDEELALECIHAGAHDVLDKDSLFGGRLPRAIENSLARRQAGELHLVRRHLERDRRLAGEGVLALRTHGSAQPNVPLQARLPAEFYQLADAYRILLRAYIDELDQPNGATAGAMQSLILSLAASGGAARDLIDIHTAILDAIPRDKATEFRPLVVEGRLFALEMMGLLVDCYRLSHEAPSSKMDA